MELHFIGKIGIAPEVFWDSTLRQLFLMRISKEEDRLFLQRNFRAIKETMRKYARNPWDGKRYDSSNKHVYPLPGDEDGNEVFSGEEGLNFLASMIDSKNK